MTFTIIKSRLAYTPEQELLLHRLRALQQDMCAGFHPATAATMLSVAEGRAWALAHVHSSARERGDKLFAGVSQ